MNLWLLGWWRQKCRVIRYIMPKWRLIKDKNFFFQPIISKFTRLMHWTLHMDSVQWTLITAQGFNAANSVQYILCTIQYWIMWICYFWSGLFLSLISAQSGIKYRTPLKFWHHHSNHRIISCKSQLLRLNRSKNIRTYLGGDLLSVRCL